MRDFEQIKLFLNDDEWKYEYTDHDRPIARGIVFDAEMNFYFVRVVRDDIFGNATLIETSGGGMEENEAPERALIRELKEELGAEAEIICKIGVVEDFYNLIHRHNINNYYLCRALSFGEKSLTEDEISRFHLSTLKLTFDEAVTEYQRCACTPIGRLIANRELPILLRAKEIIDSMQK